MTYHDMAGSESQEGPPRLLGIDTGGTFTDFVYQDGADIQVHKVLSRPDAPEEAIMTGIRELGLMAQLEAGRLKIVQGTTVATNAMLTSQGVRTAYITNKGMRDILSIGRQTRTELYNLQVSKPTLDIDPDLLFEINARMSATGEEIAPLLDAELVTLRDQVLQAKPEAVAINMLFSFIDDSHERAIEALFSEDFFTSRSSAVLPEYREYERGVATWINAWLGPLIERYLSALAAALAPSPVAIMQSSGLTIAADQAAHKAVNLLLSGPVGGLSAALVLGAARGQKQLMTFDMGGTSTDVALMDGRIRLTNENKIAGLPIAIPMADIHTIGAGGGSIAWVDEGGLLQTGPASAGADPGPACYAQGGKQATVTDANLVLGRLDPQAFLGGKMHLDYDAAWAALSPLARQLGMPEMDTAQGIIDLANEHMAQALRAISIERGFDPREYSLVCFGGAGGLHLCQLASSLEMTKALVPLRSGVLSAFGMLVTRPGREVTRTSRLLLTQEEALIAVFEEMEQLARQELEAEGVREMTCRRSLDLRYRGQTATLNVPFHQTGEGSKEEFRRAHRQGYGHELEREVELVNLKLHLEASGEDVALPQWPGAVKCASTRGDRRHGTDYESGSESDYESGSKSDYGGGSESGKASSDKTRADKASTWVSRETLGIDDIVQGPASITEDHATTYVAEGWCAQPDQHGNLVLSRGSRRMKRNKQKH